MLEGAVAAEPEHAPSLLLLGTLLRRDGDGRGTALLERFLELAPGHPAAADVREQLAGRPGGSEAPAGMPEDAQQPATEEQR